MRIAPSLALVLCCAVLAACGDDDGEGETAAGSTDPTTSTAAAGATGATGDFQGEPCPAADSPPNITNVTAFGASCEAVEDAMAQIGSVATKFKLGDFSCERTKGSELAGTWTCSGEATYFTFEFAD